MDTLVINELLLWLLVDLLGNSVDIMFDEVTFDVGKGWTLGHGSHCHVSQLAC